MVFEFMSGYNTLYFSENADIQLARYMLSNLILAEKKLVLFTII
jgi:hypothetical protein